MDLMCGMVLFEWLKSNHDSISPEDLRSIKMKRSTIENAVKTIEDRGFIKYQTPTLNTLGRQ
jgi:DNA-binding MarR family transcriptional regulator